MATGTAQPEERPLDHPSPDWPTSYTQVLARSAAGTAKTLRLYQETLEYVSQGRLPATIFQEHFPHFIQHYGASYADRAAKIGAEFLSGLAELNGSGHLRAGEANGLHEAVVPPLFDASNPARWFEQYAEYAGKLNAQALKAYRRQLDRVAAGELTAEDVQEKTATQMSQELPEYLQRVGQLYLELIEQLDDLRSNYEEDYFEGILALVDGSKDGPVNFVTLRGPLGGAAFTSLTVTNTTEQRTAIHYIATEVRRLDGVEAAFSPKVAITPEVLELGPGEEAAIAFSLQLEAGKYEAETPYIGFLYITGEGDLRVEIQLRIVATRGNTDEVN
ncbi:MAG: hypothetical protein JST61_01135 [Acidobacteria bacterium]|nr:hypothetical protein [Acidobacteriota bacterium]